MPAAEPKIELREVSLALDGKAVLEQLSLHIPADGVTCLTRALRLRQDDALLPDRRADPAPMRRDHQACRTRPSFLFQEDRLIPWLTARGNVRAVLPPSGGGAGGPAAAGSGPGRGCGQLSGRALGRNAQARRACTGRWPTAAGFCCSTNRSRAWTRS